MTELNRPSRLVGASCLIALVLAGCASSRHTAPVEDRATASRTAPKAADAAKPAASAPAAAEGKAGSYVVKPGDTLMRIALESGLGWRDIARWNNIENPNLIEPGQVLRLAPPGTAEGAASSKPVASTRVDAKPLDATRPAASSASSAAPSGSAATSAVAGASTAASAGAPAAPAAAAAADGEIKWQWPAAGPVVAAFDNTLSKGIDIGGKAGDPVYASAPGVVMYAGAHRGYGNIVIIKHNENYLTAYAHNQVLLVKEDQAVKKGQKIAEMGSTDAERVKLHFEIRHQGKPLDPAKLLPGR